MFCLNCGSKVADNAKFCTKCGARIPDSKAEPARPAEDLSETVHLDETEDKPLLCEAPLKRDAYVSTSGAAKQNRKPLMIGGAVLGLAAVVTAIAVTMGGGSEGNLKKQMKAVLEENYEEVIIAFEKAIEIDPKNAEAYVKLAEVYVQQEDYASAVQILLDARTEGVTGNYTEQVESRLAESRILLAAAEPDSPLIIDKEIQKNTRDGAYEPLKGLTEEEARNAAWNAAGAGEKVQSTNNKGTIHLKTTKNDYLDLDIEDLEKRYGPHRESHDPIYDGLFWGDRDYTPYAFVNSELIFVGGPSGNLIGISCRNPDVLFEYSGDYLTANTIMKQMPEKCRDYDYYTDPSMEEPYNCFNRMTAEIDGEVLCIRYNGVTGEIISVDDF